MRKHKFPAEFQNLTDAQIDQINTWLDDHSYRIVHEKLESELGIKMTTSKLARYSRNRTFAEDLCDETDLDLTVRDFYKLNGEPVPYNDIALELIAKRNFQFLLSQRDISASQLIACHRLATYKTTLDLAQRRLALAEHKHGIIPSSASASVSPAPITHNQSSIPNSQSPPTVPSAKPASRPPIKNQPLSATPPNTIITPDESSKLLSTPNTKPAKPANPFPSLCRPGSTTRPASPSLAQLAGTLVLSTPDHLPPEPLLRAA